LFEVLITLFTRISGRNYVFRNDSIYSMVFIQRRQNFILCVQLITPFQVNSFLFRKDIKIEIFTKIQVKTENYDIFTSPVDHAD